jgi:Spy/CpxP family protein refolding chaperone
MKPELAQIVETELKRFAADLNLSDAQRTQLKSVLEKGRERLDEVREKHPDATKADLIAKLREARGSLREQVVKFLTPEQLTKWDAEVAKAKAFLGHALE